MPDRPQNLLFLYTDEHEMYNLREDPDEAVNLAGRDDH